MSRAVSILLLMLLAVLSGCSARPELPADDGALGAFSLKERSGRTVTNDDLKGKVWIACFVFTRCSGPCPQVTTTMAKLQQELKLADEKDLRLVTITVDPARDQPDDLKKYADAFSAHPEKWLFLTGEEATIHELLNKQFGVSAAPNPDGKPGDEFAHSTRLVLIDKKGHKRGYFEGMSLLNGEPNPDYEPSQVKLRKAVTALLRGSSQSGFDFPLLNASLNAAAGVFLVTGYIAIRRRAIGLHKLCMLTAVVVSAIFLSCYLYYHIVVQKGNPTYFSERAPDAPTWVARTYQLILISHVVLAAVLMPMALRVAYLGLKDRLEKHVRLARWTFPIWLYVSITGVVVYWMLYRLY